MALLIKTDGTTINVAPKKGNTFSLAELQHFVDGYIECVRLNRTKCLIVNEEGKLRGLPMNYRATLYYKMHIRTSDFIAGDALLCDINQVD